MSVNGIISYESGYSARAFTFYEHNGVAYFEFSINIEGSMTGGNAYHVATIAQGHRPKLSSNFFYLYGVISMMTLVQSDGKVYALPSASLTGGWLIVRGSYLLA